MTRFTKALASAAALLAIASTANAESAFSVDFKYTPSASAERNYADFKRTSRRACQSEYRSVRAMGMRHNLIKACQSQLLDRVVSQINDPAILALHNPADARPRLRLFAQN